MITGKALDATMGKALDDKNVEVDRNLTSTKSDLLNMGSFASVKEYEILADCNSFAQNTTIAIGIFGVKTINKPFEYGNIIQCRMSSYLDNDFISQLAIAPTGIFYRFKQNGIWGSWIAVK